MSSNNSNSLLSITMVNIKFDKRTYAESRLSDQSEAYTWKSKFLRQSVQHFKYLWHERRWQDLYLKGNFSCRATPRVRWPTWRHIIFKTLSRHHLYLDLLSKNHLLKRHRFTTRQYDATCSLPQYELYDSNFSYNVIGLEILPLSSWFPFSLKKVILDQHHNSWPFLLLNQDTQVLPGDKPSCLFKT